MKRKHLKRVIISSIQALLMCVVFLFAPVFVQAQTQYTGNQGEIIGTSDSRMAITILESEGHVVLQVTAVGVIQANAFGLTLVYQPNALVLTDNTFAYDIPLGLDPADFGSPVIQMEPNFVSLYSTFNTQVMNHRVIISGLATGMHTLNTAVGSNDPRPTSPMNMVANQMLPVYKIFFRKQTSGVPLQTSDLGFFYNSSIPRTSSKWNYNGVSVSSNNLGASDAYYANSYLFVYRSPSSSTTLDADELAENSVRLNGNYIRGDFMPASNMFVSGYTSATNTGRINYDTVNNYGFIYTLEDAEIEMKELNDSIVIDGNTYPFPSISEITAGTFIRGGKTFSIISNNNSVSSQSVNYSESLTGLTSDTNYYYWSFTNYTFETSGTYVAVGEKKMFRPSAGCNPPATPIALTTQAFCVGATIADLIAYVEPGTDLVWYNDSYVMLDPADILIDGATYYGKASINGCESDSVAVIVILNNGLVAPDATTPQIFCPGSLVSDLQATGTGIRWYDAATDGNLLSDNDPLVDGQTYYAVQISGICESSTRTAVKIAIEDATLSAPVIGSPQSFCENATLADIATDGSVIVWYNASGALLPSTTLLSNGTTYYAARKAGTCESALRTPVLVYTGMTYIMPPIVSTPQRFCPGAILANIVVPNNQIIWYASATGNALLPANTLLVDNNTYYAAQKAGECESTDRTPVRVYLSGQQGPSAPSPQTFCGTGVTLADLMIIGNGIVWYDAMTGGNLLPSSTALTAIPTTYYAAQRAGSCESTRIGILASSSAIPIPIVHTDKSVCRNTSTFDLTTAVDQTPSYSYVYYYNNTGTVISDPTVVPVPDTDTTYYVKAISTLVSGCESNYTPIPMAVNAAPQVSVTPAGAYTSLNGTTTITITDDNTNTALNAKTAIIQDTSIANISLANGVLTVTGKKRGNTEVIYTSVNNSGCLTGIVIPIQVEGLPTGILLGKDIVKCSGDTTMIQIAYIMGGIAPWTVTVSDDRGIFTEDTIIRSIEEFPVNMIVNLPVNTTGVPEFTTYTISRVEDGARATKLNHYGAVRVGTNPKPIINTIANKVQTVCSGATTLPISFNGTATVYRWSVDKNIGLVNYSTGIIPSFTATTNSNQADTATIIITPEYWYNGIVCIGDPDTATIIVRPKPAITTIIPNWVLCSGDSLNVNFNGNADTYSWSYTSTNTSSIGFANTGNGNISEKVINASNIQIIATFVVTPKYEATLGGCQGEPVTFNVTVNPEFRMISATDMGEMCSDTRFNYIARSNMANVAFNWTRPAISGINNGAAGNGNDGIIGEMLYNHTGAPIEVKYIIGLSNGSCLNTDTVRVIVNPAPEIYIDPVVTICGNVSEISIPYTLNSSQQNLNILYSITFNEAALLAGFRNISNVTLSGGTIIIQSPGSLPTGSYGATLSVGTIDGCVNSTTYPFYIQTGEYTIITEQPESVSICNNEGFSLSVVAMGTGLSYQWYKNGQAITGAASSSYTVAESDSATHFGNYYVVVTGGCGNVTSQTVTVGRNGLTLLTKWTDVIFISNKGKPFVAYQWYKDGVPIALDGNYQSYVENGGLNGTYQVMVTYADGSKAMSCPYTVHLSTAKKHISIYPNPVPVNEELTVDISQFISGEPDNVKLEIFDVTGKQIVKLNMVTSKQKIRINAPKGSYVLRLTTGQGETVIEKIIVH